MKELRAGPRGIEIHFDHAVRAYTGQPVPDNVLLPDGGINASTGISSGA